MSEQTDGGLVADLLAKVRKVPLNMESDERYRLMDVLLRIQKLAGDAFDVIEAQMVSERDVLHWAQLPEYCNSFVDGVKRYALRQIQPSGRPGHSDA